MRVRTSSGLEIAFNRVAEVKVAKSFTTIRRVDRQRALNITADVTETTIGSRHHPRGPQQIHDHTDGAAFACEVELRGRGTVRAREQEFDVGVGRGRPVWLVCADGDPVQELRAAFCRAHSWFRLAWSAQRWATCSTASP